MAGSINLANVALGFDSSKITKGVDLSAGEIRKLSGIVKSSESSIDRYNKELAILETAYAKGAISAKRMQEATEHLHKVHKQGVADAGSKTMSLGYTELASKVALARQGFDLLKGAITPVFNEMNRIDAINDQAHKLGMSYRDLNTIQLALGESSGLAAEDIATAMQKLSIGVTEAITTGKGAHAEALKTLGLNASALAGKNQVDQLSTIADAMEGIASQSERLKLTFDLFGKAGAGLVSSFDEGGGKLREMAQFADEFGLNLSGEVVEGINNANDAMGRLSMATQGWLAQFSGGAASQFEAIADHLTGALKPGEGVAKAGENTGEFAATLYGMFADVGRILSRPPTEMRISDFGHTNALIQWEAMAAKGRAEAQAEEKADQQKQISERQDQSKKEEASANELKKTIDLFYNLAKMENDRINDENKQTNEFKKREKEIWDDAFGRDIEQRFKTNPMNISDTIAPALKSGSVEAYKFMLNQKDRAADIAEEQRRIADESKDILNQQLEALNKMPQLRLAR